jgi:two-component system chemotaxis response regulator CheB
MAKQVRIALADPTPTEAKMVLQVLESDPQIKVVSVAQTAAAIVEEVRRLRPNLVIMDLNLPGQGVFQAVERIMGEVATPILVLTSTKAPDPLVAKRLIASGALEVLPKPSTPQEWVACAPEFMRRVKILAQVQVVTHLAGRRRSRKLAAAKLAKRPGQPVEVVAIGASTGGPKALMQLLSVLPADFGAGVLVAQHIAQGFLSGLREWLAEHCSLAVHVAEDEMPVKPGQVILAREDRHMLVNRAGVVRLSSPNSTRELCPSADRLLESVASAYGPAAVGVLLSGMGQDGARGLEAIRQAGGWTIAQDEETSVVFGMPQAAIQAGAALEVLPLPAIAQRLIELSLWQG